MNKGGQSPSKVVLDPGENSADSLPCAPLVAAHHACFADDRTADGVGVFNVGALENDFDASALGLSVYNSQTTILHVVMQKKISPDEHYLVSLYGLKMTVRNQSCF